MSKSPVIKVAPDAPKDGYEIVLRFNDKAELINVEHPHDMTLATINNHVAVATLYLAQQLAKDAD